MFTVENHTQYNKLYPGARTGAGQSLVIPAGAGPVPLDESDIAKHPADFLMDLKRAQITVKFRDNKLTPEALQEYLEQLK
jgi:hypothetical protein